MSAIITLESAPETAPQNVECEVLEKSFHPAFDGIVGQAIAKQNFTDSISSAKNDGEMISPLITAAAGVGKSKIARAYISALADEGFDTLSFDSPEEFRSKGEAYSSLMSLIMDSPRYAIFIDEAHLLRYKATVQTDTMLAFLMKALDKGNNRKTIRIGAETTAVFDRCKASIVLATNFPNILDKSGALQSRCDLMELEEYTEPQLVKILQGMLVAEDFRPASEKTLAMIAKCGRGTARPMEKIVGKLKIANNAAGGTKHTINRDDVISALRLSKMFPRGLHPEEIKIMKKCLNVPVRDNVLLATLPSMEQAGFRKSKGYLMGECGFLAPTTGGSATTEKGRRYLEECRKSGFAVDAV